MNGGSIERSNKAGKTVADFLITKVSSELVIEMVTRLASIKIPVRNSSGGMSCMGRRDCNQPPVHLLSCPHKPACKFCYNCFLLFASKIKCGCVDEDVEPIPSSVGSKHPSDLSSDREEESLELEEIEPDLLSYDTSLVQGGAFGVGKEEGSPTIQLQLFHDPPDVLKRKLAEEEKQLEGTICCIPSSVSKLVIEFYGFYLGSSSPKKGRPDMTD